MKSNADLIPEPKAITDRNFNLTVGLKLEIELEL